MGGGYRSGLLQKIALQKVAKARVKQRARRIVTVPELQLRTNMDLEDICLLELPFLRRTDSAYFSSLSSLRFSTGTTFSFRNHHSIYKQYILPSVCASQFSLIYAYTQIENLYTGSVYMYGICVHL